MMFKRMMMSVIWIAVFVIGLPIACSAMKEVPCDDSFRTLKGHSNVIKALAITPNGQYLFSGSWDNTVKVWDVGT